MCPCQGVDIVLSLTTRNPNPSPPALPVSDVPPAATDVDELFVLSIDPDDGAINWVWQSEANATAFGTGGVVMADDGISPIISGIAFGNQFNLSFTYWEVRYRRRRLGLLVSQGEFLQKQINA